jgi:hypothetical protein
VGELRLFDPASRQECLCHMVMVGGIVSSPMRRSFDSRFAVAQDDRVLGCFDPGKIKRKILPTPPSYAWQGPRFRARKKAL